MLVVSGTYQNCHNCAESNLLTDIIEGLENVLWAVASNLLICTKGVVCTLNMPRKVQIRRNVTSTSLRYSLVKA
jgi:hypothetical protein